MEQVGFPPFVWDELKNFAGLADVAMHSPFKRDEAGSIPASRTKICAGSSTDQNSWPTTNRCGFNSRTAHHAGLARRSSPRSIIARRWFDSIILHRFLEGTATLRCGTLANGSPRLGARIGSPTFTGDWHRWLMHSPLKRDQAGSIPASPTIY